MSQAQPENKYLVRTTKSVTLSPFSTTAINGSTKLRSHGMRLNLVAEPSDCIQLPSSVQFVLTYCILEPDSNRVAVGLKIFQLKPSPSYPRMLWVNCNKPGMVLIIRPPNLSRVPLGRKGDSWILDQLNLEGLESWTGEQQQSAKDLLANSADVFSQSDLDLDKCDIIKHAIKITEPQCFKERYRRIPPLLYEEVKTHLQEMVEVGAIRRSFSPGTVLWCLSEKRWGA